MNMKNILVAFNGTDSSESALRYACGLARQSNAHVTAVLAHSRHEVVNSRAAWVPVEATRIIDAANSDFLAGIEARFDALRADLDMGDRLHFQRVPGRVDSVLSEYAQVHDTLVMGQDQAEESDPHVSIHIDRIALISGRPILIIPKDQTFEGIGGKAVLAWDGGRAAARAMGDSLQFLSGGTEVGVLTVGDIALPRPIEDVIQHLSRNGLVATHEARAVETGIAETILDHCASVKPSLLVMGAYEHSKFREDFFGGVTAQVLLKSPCPVLLSH